MYSGLAAPYSEVYSVAGEDYVRSNGFQIHLNRQKVFNRDLTLTDWHMQKERRLFAKGPLPKDFPRFDVTFTGSKAHPVLLSTLVHELGHVVDSLMDVAPNDERWTGLWASMSWQVDGAIRTEDRYMGARKPCYYNCAKVAKIPLKYGPRIYRELIRKGSFISTYASVNPKEDFAETFAYQVLSQLADGTDIQFKYALVFPNGTNNHWFGAASRVQAKLEYIQRLFAMPWPEHVMEEAWQSVSLQEYLRQVHAQVVREKSIPRDNHQH